jgi:hypothetical protein
MVKKLSSRCPFCSGDLAITSLHCEGCGTAIESKLVIPKYFRLGTDLQGFVLVFLRCRGNIREVEKELGISYPTVCKRLDLVNELLANSPSDHQAAPEVGGQIAEDGTVNARRQQILEDLEAGKFGAGEAAQLLRALNDVGQGGKAPTKH